MMSLSNVHVNTLREHGWTHLKSRLLSQQGGLQSGKQALVTLSFSVCGWYSSIYVEHTQFKIPLCAEFSL